MGYLLTNVPAAAPAQRSQATEKLQELDSGDLPQKPKRCVHHGGSSAFCVKSGHSQSQDTEQMETAFPHPCGSGGH